VFRDLSSSYLYCLFFVAPIPTKHSRLLPLRRALGPKEMAGFIRRFSHPLILSFPPTLLEILFVSNVALPIRFSDLSVIRINFRNLALFPYADPGKALPER